MSQDKDLLLGAENVPEILDDSDIEAAKNSVVKNVLWQMNLDRKTTPLKNLQALILKNGFENNQLKGE